MIENEILKEHLATSSTIQSNALIVAEWNLNVRENIYTIGNYRYRPIENIILSPTNRSIYSTLNNSFDPNDQGYFYTNATDADAVIDGGVTDDGTPTAFKSLKQKEKLLYSLEDCFGKFRPRSGINKLRYFDDKYFHHVNPSMDKRPRYYFADASDSFKYWSSYRTEAQYQYTYENGNIQYGPNPVFIDGVSTKNGLLISAALEKGIAKSTFITYDNISIVPKNYIDDAAPFIVYKNSVPANRIIVKMQTNIGTVDLGPFTDDSGTFADPFYGQENSTTPVIWKIQYLKNNNWIDAVSFNESSTRSDGSPIVGADGYVELSYGLVVPEQYRQVFYKAGQYYSTHAIPEIATQGEAYLIKSSPTDIGIYYIWFNGQYETFVPNYDWYLTEVELPNSSALATELVDVDLYDNALSNETEYREFQYIDGIRIVVDTMTKIGSTFDLIELSARLTVDISDKTVDYSISKTASDLGVSGMPVGQLLAGIGSINIFDYDLAFSVNNPNSIIKDFLLQNTQIKFFDVIVDNQNIRHVVPIKTMYIEEFPEIDLQGRTVSLNLRDLFFLFESTTAPELLIPNAPLSYAISLLLDNVGFSNYVFKYNEDEAEPVIPFFFVQTDITIAEVLNQLALSTQTAMFFDEQNNFVTMSKNYIMPSVEERLTDIVLYGSTDFVKEGAYQNKTTNTNLANIIEMSAQENRIYNAGTINYKTRYIKRTYGNTAQSKYTGSGKTWIYQPALLWEVAPDANLYPVNEQVENQSGYALGAVPLNSDLSALVPAVENHRLVNNVIDFGEAIVNYLTKYNGYFYANGEIIKYDAIEFSVSGEAETVWINNTKEFQKYFARLAFGGKIFPTGLVRIYAEPNYETIDGITRMKNGAVAKHGRGQFGTPIVFHPAGLSSYWSSNDIVRGCRMDTRYLFGDFEFNTGNLIVLESFEFFDVDDEHTDFELFDENLISSLTAGDTVQIKYFINNIDIPTTAVATTTIDRVDYVNKTFRVTTPLTVLDYLVPGLTPEESSVELPIEYDTLTLVGSDIVTNTTGTTIQINVPTGAQAGDLLVVVGLLDESTSSWTTNEGWTERIDKDGRMTSSIIWNGTTASYTFTASKAIEKTLAILCFRNAEWDRISQMGRSATNPVAPKVSIDLDDSYVIAVASTKDKETTYAAPEGWTAIKSSKDNNSLGIFLKNGYQLEGTSPETTFNRATGSGTKSKAWQFSISPTISSDSVMSGESIISSESGQVLDYYMYIITQEPVNVADYQAAGVDNELALRSTRTGVIKNYFSSSDITENELNHQLVTQTGTVQSSALSFAGGRYTDGEKPIQHISYVYKELDDNYKHFGARMRIVGTILNTSDEGAQDKQKATGSMQYYSVPVEDSEKTKNISGGSGGIAIGLNKDTNIGYYFEIIAVDDLSTSSDDANLNEFEDFVFSPNLLFYRVVRNTEPQEIRNTEPQQFEPDAVPVKLWAGVSNILVDSGDFVGQYRKSNETNSTVYDLAVEYENIGTTRRFYLYVNNKLVAVVDDPEPLPEYNNMALFVRGSSKCMFENLYAITGNYAFNENDGVAAPVQNVFANKPLSIQDSFQKYALSGMIQSTYLSGINPSTGPQYNMYFEEFGTIMREAAYFKVKYDKAYPALYSKIAPTFNDVKGYTVSGYLAGAYGAEFLVFNHTDTFLTLDDETGNYLRIQGIGFTQESDNELSVDEYFNEIANLSNPVIQNNMLVGSPIKNEQDYFDIKTSRINYGRREFTLEADYIQSQDQAFDLMQWMVSKIMKPRMSIGINVFANPLLQLGDIVEISYNNLKNNQTSIPENSRFVIYSIEYSRSIDGPRMAVYLSEVK